MKKILFISNVTNKLTNFAIPSIFAAQSLNYEFHLASNLSNFNDDSSKYNIILHHIDIKRNPLSIKNILAFKQMLNLIKKEKIDAIHCNTPIGGLLGRLCGKKNRVSKIIYTAHGFHFYKGAPLINKLLYKFVEKWLARYTDVIITINEEDYMAAQTFKLRNNGKVYLIPGVGIDTLTIDNVKTKREEILNSIGASPESILIISVGELNKNKNNEVIIKALGRLNNQNIHYLLCGTGNKKNKLHTLAKKYGLSKNVHFLGYRTDVSSLLKSCDVFVLPSYREGLSRALMEAMSAGLPCIVSKIRGNIDLIQNGNGGFLCNPDDVEGFAQAINYLATDLAKRKTMGNINLKNIKYYDVKNVKEKLLSIYKEVL